MRNISEIYFTGQKIDPFWISHNGRNFKILSQMSESFVIKNRNLADLKGSDVTHNFWTATVTLIEAYLNLDKNFISWPLPFIFSKICSVDMYVALYSFSKVTLKLG